MTCQIQQIPWYSPLAEEVRRIRFAVFVDEQKVPAELELDDFDEGAIHILALNQHGQPCGTARMYTDPDYAQRAKIGRMAVLPSARGTGYGAAMLRYLVDLAREQGFGEAALTAQTHAIRFYEKQGFAAEGEEFLDAGIPHYFMRLNLIIPPL